MMTLRTTAQAALLGFGLAALLAHAQPTEPFVYRVENSASYSNTIAQGSIFVVFGANFGPSQLVQANTYPLPSQLGGVTITVTSGPVTVTCPMVYATAGSAAAIFPSNVPVGTAMLTLSNNQQTTPFPTPVTVAPIAAGLYTLSSSGMGPGVFTGGDGAAKTFASSAKTGEIVTAWATGLGPVSGPANALPDAFAPFPGIEVFVGTQSANVLYAGRSGCCVGLDQISFQIPPGVQGCYVPVAVRAAGAISNFVSMPVMSNGGQCSDSAPTLPVSILDQASAGQSVRVAGLAVGEASLLQALGFSFKPYLAAKLSKLLRTKVSERDVGRLMAVQQLHNSRALNRILMKFGPQWKALNAAGKAAVQAAINPNQQGAAASFGQFSAASVLAVAFSELFPSEGTCTVFPNDVPRSAVGLDAGSSLSLSGPPGPWTLMPTGVGRYQVLFGSGMVGPGLAPGTYVITSSGGNDLGPFSVSLISGESVHWINKAGISSVDRSQPLTITWSGGPDPGYVAVGGYVVPNTAPTTGFVCVEDATKRSFTIPSFILSALPAATKGGLFVSPHLLSQGVSISGVDLAYFMNAGRDSQAVAFK